MSSMIWFSLLEDGEMPATELEVRRCSITGKSALFDLPSNGRGGRALAHPGDTFKT